MARSLGIYLRPDGYSYALLDGSAKRFSLKACGSGGFDGDGAGEPDLGRALARGLKEGDAGRADQVILCLPSQGAVLRQISLPFQDREKVQQVLKFEVEPDLYHLDIEDVICDYLELQDERATTSILVSAVPKTHVASGLAAAEEAGFDPQTLELDLAALAIAVRDARTRRGAAAGGPDELEAYLYFGPYSSLLLVQDAAGTRSIRAMHVGWRELSRGLESGAPEDAAVEEMSIRPGAEEEEEAQPEPAPAPPAALFNADPTLDRQASFDDLCARSSGEAQAALLRRLVGEVRRGLAALPAVTVGRIHLLGAPWPGLAGALAERLGVPAVPFEFGLDAAGGGAPDAIAYGAALRGLGVAGPRMNFRQEEFRFTRGLERVEGPLTFLLMGLIAFLLVDAVVHVQKTRALKRDTDALFERSAEVVDEWLNAKLREGDPKSWHIRTDFAGTDVTDLQRIDVLRTRLDGAKRELDEMVGEAGVEMPQSCLEAWRLVNSVLESELAGGAAERWMVESLEFTSSLRERVNEEPHVVVKLGLTLFGDSLVVANHLDTLLAAFNRQPWNVEPASNDGLKEAAVPNARTTVLSLKVSTAKAKESGA